MKHIKEIGILNILGSILLCRILDNYLSTSDRPRRSPDEKNNEYQTKCGFDKKIMGFQ